MVLSTKYTWPVMISVLADRVKSYNSTLRCKRAGGNREILNFLRTGVWSWQPLHARALHAAGGAAAAGLGGAELLLTRGHGLALSGGLAYA